MLDSVRLAVFLSALISQIAFADSWNLPDTYSVPSSNRKFRFRVHPSDEQNPRPTGVLYRVRPLLRDQELWTAPLVNLIGPAAAMVSDSGKYVVTFDDWRQVGSTLSALAIYDSSGNPIAQFALEHLATDDEIAQMFESMSGVWWLGDAKFVLDGEFLDVTLKGMPAHASIPELRFVKLRTLRIRLSDGTIVSPTPAA